MCRQEKGSSGGSNQTVLNKQKFYPNTIKCRHCKGTMILSVSLEAVFVIQMIFVMLKVTEIQICLLTALFICMSSLLLYK